MQNKSYPRVQIIINADSNEEIQQSVSWLNGTVQQSATEWPSESPATKVKKSSPKNIKTEGDAPDDVIHTQSDDNSKPEKADTKTTEKSDTKSVDKSDEVSLDDLRKKMSAVLKAGKRDEAKALLAEFDTPKLGELDPSKFVEFGKGLDKLLGGD